MKTENTLKGTSKDFIKRTPEAANLTELTNAWNFKASSQQKKSIDEERAKRPGKKPLTNVQRTGK